MRRDKKFLIGAVIGTAITALCCFTPILIILFATVGLGALTGYLDYVLIPALFVFIGLTIYAYNKYKKGSE
ncbi:mercury resistance system transport protein MerF [Pseudalkalibacillus berkeleyi]|uniref:Mercury resistance system transport protein MerF n=1 Tax=Pseudalkalibacillus berkeleyi TaxID=1069813 RepID=A0ABS9GXF8_9BACL|nr:mercury resistance system transport protein MerF [Pseudalkalibacillus berkeleyi]MCF6136421.1 mercury resistance system transport protein MerF [Pseudalkalibacillus berkeleyi]